MQAGQDGRAEGALLPRRAPHLGEVEVQERAGSRDAALDRRHRASFGKLDLAPEHDEIARDRAPGSKRDVAAPDDDVARHARRDPDVGQHRDDAAGEILGNDDVLADRGDGGRNRAGGAGEAEEEEARENSEE